MTIPCTQETAIRQIHAMQQQITSQLQEMTSALQTLAAQQVAINSLIKTQDEHRAWLRGHEKRIHHCELNAQEIKEIKTLRDAVDELRMTPGKVAIASLVLIAAGFIGAVATKIVGG